MRADGFYASGATTPDRHRRQAASELEWLELLYCLRKTGMPIRQVHRYVDPTFMGDETIREQVVLLCEHRANVLAPIAELQHHLDTLAWNLADDADTFRVIAREATP